MREEEQVGVHCPWCGEPIELTVDAAALGGETIEDCSVCCRPMNLRIEMVGGEPFVSASTDDE